MPKLTYKIALPIISAGVFIIATFVAIDYERLGASFYVILLFLTIYVFSFGIAIGQKLSSPIKELLDRAKDLGKGDLSSKVYSENKDEIAQLAEVFNKISDELKSSREQESILEKSVGVKVMAKTRDLEETINALEQKVKNRTIELEKLVAESGKLQADAKNKEEEVVQLRTELGAFKQKLGKYGKFQKSPQNEVAEGENV